MVRSPFFIIFRLFYKQLPHKFFIEIDFLVIFYSVLNELFSSVQNTNGHQVSLYPQDSFA